MADNADVPTNDAEAAMLNANEDQLLPDETKETEVEEKDTQIEESPAQDNKKDKSEADDTKAKEATDNTKEDPKEESEETEKPQEDEKSEPDKKEQARRAYQERQKTRQQIAKQLDGIYGPKTQEDLLNEGYSESDAKIEALRQEMLYRDQRNNIAELNATLQADAHQVLSDFPMFNPNSPEFDPEYTQKVQERYQRAAQLQYDDNGIVINANEGLYDFYEFAADAYGRGSNKGQQAGQKNAVKMLSRTETPSGASETMSEETEDLFLKGFDKGSSKY